MNIAASTRPPRCLEPTPTTIHPESSTPNKYRPDVYRVCVLNRGHAGDHWDGWAQGGRTEFPEAVTE